MEQGRELASKGCKLSRIEWKKSRSGFIEKEWLEEDQEWLREEHERSQNKQEVLVPKTALIVRTLILK